MQQHSLDDYAANMATTARDSGMAAAWSGDAQWFEDVLEWICGLPMNYRFDADLIRSVHGRSPAAGSVVNTAQRRGWIPSVGVARSKSVTRHRGLILESERV